MMDRIDLDPATVPAADIPAALGELERARAVLRTGWRPPLGEGPTRDELAELIGTAAVAPV